MEFPAGTHCLRGTGADCVESFSALSGLVPKVAGGWRSLLYFREIAKRKETAFIAEFSEQSEEAYLKDLLAQVWRNSEILKQKYDYIKYSFIVLLCALPP